MSEARGMRAMVLRSPREPLRLEQRPIPRAGPGELVLRVLACGLCRTDLHVADGELAGGVLPIVPGHQIVGELVERGAGVSDPPLGARLGVPWLASTCGTCAHCRSERENLCPFARFTGFHVDGGFAEYALARSDACFPLPADFPDLQAAPLLCAGLIGYRALRFAGDARRVGLYGFGAAAHLLAQVLRFQGRETYAFTRPGDLDAQAFARELGAVWAGGSDEAPPVELEAALLFAPVGALVPTALRHLAPGGRVVCAGIHMSDLPSFPYSILWMERSVQSVANLTRRDGSEFLALAPQVPVRSEVHAYPLEEANRALDDLRHGRFRGAAVLVP